MVRTNFCRCKTLFELFTCVPVVYHDDLTDAFLEALRKIMAIGKDKIAYIAMEKRLEFLFSLLKYCFTSFSHLI